MLWSSEEIGFCELPDAWSSTSSIMPQKKNPDAAELLRAKAPRIVGHLSALHGVLHALPLAYNKDFQEDKEHVFDTADTLEPVARRGAGHDRGRALRSRAARSRGVRRGDRGNRARRRARAPGCPLPPGAWRGRGPRACGAREQRRSLSALTAEELVAADGAFGERTDEIYELLRTPEAWLESKVSEGGTARARVEEQITAAEELLDGYRHA